MEKDFFNQFLKSGLSEFDWLLEEMEKRGGWLRLPQPLVDTISKFKLQWWKAYDNPRLFNIYHALMYVDLETIKSIQTPEEAEELKEAITQVSYELISSPELRDSHPLTEEEKQQQIDELQSFLDNATEEERKEFWQQIAFYWLGLLLAFHEILALMVQGKSMRQLVKDAKNGDDEAYVLAVQADRTILNHPYFLSRLQNAHLSGDTQFLDALGYRLKNPIIRGKITRRTLYLFFALLDSENRLDMPLKELLELCQEVGVYGKEYGVGDTDSLRKRLKDYRDNQRTRKIF